MSSNRLATLLKAIEATNEKYGEDAVEVEKIAVHAEEDAMEYFQSQLPELNGVRTIHVIDDEEEVPEEKVLKNSAV